MRAAKPWILLGVACLSLATARAETNGLAAFMVDGIAAQVNKRTITRGEVFALSKPAQRQLALKYDGEELEKRLREAYGHALNTLIEHYLQLDAYEKGDQKLPDWIVQERADEIIRDKFGGDRASLSQALAAESMTYEQWRKQIEEHLAVSYLRRARVEEQIRVSPTAVRNYYDAETNRFLKPEQIRVRILVLKKDGTPTDTEQKRTQADELRKRALAGEDFAALVRQFSNDKRAEAGGDWGWVEPAVLRPDLLALAAGLQPGEVALPLETESEVFLLKLEGRQPAMRASFEEVEQEIEDLLWQEQRDKRYSLWIESLKESAYIKVFDLPAAEAP